MIKLSQNTIQELEEKITNNAPILSTERGELYTLDNLPLGAIRLKVSLKEYFKFIESLNKHKPARFYLIHIENKNFQVAINAQVYIKSKKTFINDKEIILL